jgi:WD40 repeat protein
MAFDAFISYSHAADGRLAPALQRAIQRLAKPWYRPRALRVFRDDSALSANPHLWSSIQAALDDAEWFVLLASPDAAASEWVNRELTHWLSNKTADRILVVLTDGTLAWDGTQLTGTAVPPALRDAFTDEPRHVDLRWAATETDLDMHHARFRDVVAQLAAPMHGIAKDDLDSEDVRQHRRARRLARGGVTILTLLVIISLVFGTIAALERNDARNQRDRADASTAAAISRGLATEAERSVADNDSDTALLLSAESYRFAVESHRGIAEARQTLLASIGAAASITGYLRGQQGTPGQIVFSSDGALIASASTTGDVRVWNARTRRLLTPKAITVGPGGASLSLSREHVLATFAFMSQTIRLWDARNGRPWHWQLPPRTAADGVVLSDAGMLAVMSSQDNESFAVNLWDIHNGHHLSKSVTLRGSRMFGALFAGAFSPSGRLLAIASEVPDQNQLDVVLIDTSTGQVVRVLTGQHASLISSIEFSSDGHRLTAVASDGADGAVATWDIRTGRRLNLGTAGNGVEVIAATRDARHLLVRNTAPRSICAGRCSSASNATTSRVVDASTGMPLLAGLPVFNTAAFDPAGTTLAFGIGDAIAIVDHAAPGSLQALLHETALPKLGNNLDWSWIALAPSGRFAVRPNVADAESGVGSAYRTGAGFKVHLVDDPFVDNPRIVETARGTELPDRFSFAVLAYAFGADDTLALSTPAGILVWDTARGQVLRRITGLGTTCSNPLIEFTGDAATGHVALACEGDVTVWSLGAKHSTASWHRHYTDLTDRPLAASQEGSSLAILTATGVDVRDIATGRPLARIPFGAGSFGNYALSPNGQEFASRGDGASIDLIDTRTLSSQVAADSQPLPASDEASPALAFSPDGTMVAAWFPDGAIDVWNVASATLIAQIQASNRRAPASSGVLNFSDSGDELSVLTHNADNTSTIDHWSFRPRDLLADSCRLTGGSLSLEEWDKFVGSDVPYHRTCEPTGTSR